MSGGRGPKRKGSLFERTLVNLLRDAGHSAERVPLSGSAGGSYVGDLAVEVMGRHLTVEAKVRANGFRELYAWLEHRDALIVRADRSDPLVVVPLRLALDILEAATRGKAGGA